ncbi:DUF1499 domain-containing protein [Candidatus Gracilibacteria bacterium]|nr:DUF1499 domain-containing protein [Candidatus Gracilibacteria bacterium]
MEGYVKNITKIALFGVGALVSLGLAGIVALVIAARTVAAPDTLGVRDGKLAPCPPTPNCVSTQADDPQQQMEPIAFSGPLATARDTVLTMLSAQPRAEIVAANPDYIHAVFRSPTMQFPDDVEFYFDEEASLVHFRAAARLGRDDLGVNRTRMAQLSATLAETFGPRGEQWRNQEAEVAHQASVITPGSCKRSLRLLSAAPDCGLLV